MKLLRYLPRFRSASRALGTLADREGWPRADLEAYQLARLNALWQHAAAHVPHYRELAAKAGLPPRFASLEEYRSAVPVLHKPAIQAAPHEFLSERAERGQQVAETLRDAAESGRDERGRAAQHDEGQCEGESAALRQPERRDPDEGRPGRSDEQATDPDDVGE